VITYRGIWAIAHMLSRSSSKHSCIHGEYCRKHLLIPCPTNNIGGHILSIVSNKRVALPLTKARIGLERQRQTRAVWAKRTEYSIEQIRQSLQRLKIAKIVRMQNLHNFRTIDSVFFPTHVCDTSCQLLTHAYRKLIKVGHSSRCMLPRSRSSKQPSQSRRPSSLHDIWAIIHMLASQLAALKCFHCVTKVGYS